MINNLGLHWASPTLKTLISQTMLLKNFLNITLKKTIYIYISTFLFPGDRCFVLFSILSIILSFYQSNNFDPFPLVYCNDSVVFWEMSLQQKTFYLMYCIVIDFLHLHIWSTLLLHPLIFDRLCIMTVRGTIYDMSMKNQGASTPRDVLCRFMGKGRWWLIPCQKSGHRTLPLSVDSRSALGWPRSRRPGVSLYSLHSYNIFLSDSSYNVCRCFNQKELTFTDFIFPPSPKLYSTVVEIS